MPGINKVILIGHIGQTPELRSLAYGVKVTSFALATDETMVKQGVRTELTEWHNIIMWRSLAESAIKVLKKGQLICIEGKLATRRFTDKVGINRYTTEVIVEKYTLLGRHPSPEDEINQPLSSE
jgi:single-strand DNA-binding protein